MSATKETIILEGDDKTVKAFNSVMKNAQKMASEGEKINRIWGNMASLVSGISVGFLAREINQVVSSVGGLAKSAKVAGVLPDTLQELRYAFGQLADIADTEVDAAMKQFNTRMGMAIDQGGPAKNTFRELGISFVDVEGKIRSTEAVLNQTFEKLASIESDSVRAAKASELFGDSAGPELAQALQEGIIPLDQFRQYANDAGFVLSNDLVSGAEAAADELDNMKRTITADFNKTILDNSEAITALASAGSKLMGVFTSATGTAVNFTKFGAENVFGLISGEDPQAVQNRISKFQKDVNLVTKVRENAQKELENVTMPDFIVDEGNELDKLKEVNNIFTPEAKKAMENNKARAKELAEVQAEAKQVFESTRTEVELYNAELERLSDLLGRGAIEQETHDRAVLNAARELNKTERQTKETESAIKDLGLTFTSAAEEAAFSGAKISDVIKGLLEDLAKLAFRELVTEQILGAVSLAFSAGSGGRNVTGLYGQSLGVIPAYRAVGGPVSAGEPYIVGERGPELFVPGGNGNIVSNDKMGGLSVNVGPVSIDARGADANAVGHLRNYLDNEFGPRILFLAKRQATQNTINIMSRPRFA